MAPKIGSDSSIGWGDGVVSVKLAYLADKATGGVETPPQVDACCIFLLLLTGLLFLLMAQSRTLECRETPKRGVKKKRITLDADLALLTDATAHRLIQPVWRCLEQFYYSLSGCGTSPASTYFVNPCSKRISLLRLRIVVFVVLQSIRLVFIMVFAGFYCCCTRDIALPVPSF